MKPTLRLFTKDELEKWVDPSAFRSGAACFRKGGVGNTTISIPTKGTLRVVAPVDTGAFYPHTSSLEWDGQAFQSRCDCPLNQRCKHVVAVGLAFLEDPLIPEEPVVSADFPFLPGQEVMLYSFWPAPPPKKLESRYERPYCLWLSVDSARLMEDRLPGTPRPVGMWALPRSPLSDADKAILERLIPFHQAHSRDFSSPHARGIPLLDADLTPILHSLTGYPFVYGGGRKSLSIRPDRPVHQRHVSAWAGSEVIWELDGALIPAAPEKLLGKDPSWVLIDANFHPVIEVEGAPDTTDPEIQHHPAALAASQLIHPTAPPRPRLTLHEESDCLAVRLSFTYGMALPISPTDPRQAVGGELAGQWGFWQRDNLAESAYIQRLSGTRLDARGDGEWSAWGEDALEFLIDVIPELLLEGWDIFGEERLSSLRVDRRSTSISVHVHSGVDWFDLETIVSIDDIPLDSGSLLQAIRSGSRFVRLGTGAYARLPEEWLARQQALAGSLGFEMHPEGERIRQRVPRYQALVAKEILDAANHGQADQDWHAFVHQLEHLDSIPEERIPAGLNGELRGYQRRGLDYLCFLRDQGLNGILADDMGLGKSIQAIALLLREKENDRGGPTLLVAPTSVVYNWEQEFSRFAPELKILILHGSDRRNQYEAIDDADVVVTSYALLRRDFAVLRARRFHYVILDEAQMIKNPRSQSAKSACGLQANHRLCLTGTPIENNLFEFWSLFNFLMPGYLGSERQFRERYAKTDVPERIEQLRKKTQPFILRRLKQEVAPDLPPRSDMVSFCELGAEQRRFYDHLLSQVRREVISTVDRVGLAKSRFNVLEGLLRLRQACCDPQLVSTSEPAVPSAKVDHLMDLVREIASEGHRILVFSQFVKVLRILSKRLEEEGIAFEYLDGGTKDRMERVERFNQGTAPVFLISLKAGGTGLNLTGADYVVLFDPWWNPAVEEQATDRAHRIGQTRHVFSYKLIAKDTVEEKVLALQARKRHLAKNVLEGEGFSRAFSREDLEYLFS